MNPSMYIDEADAQDRLGSAISTVCSFSFRLLAQAAKHDC